MALGGLLLGVAISGGASTTAIAASEAGIFSVPPPTGDAAADLAGIEAALAQAKTWQAGQPKGADGLLAKAEVVLAAGTYELCPSGGTPAPRQGGHYCLLLGNWENLVLRGTGSETRIVLLDPNEGYVHLSQSRQVTIADLTLDFKTVPFTQGKIVAVHLNGSVLGSLDVALDKGFQTFADPIYQIEDKDFLVVMDPAAPRPKSGVPDFMRIAFRPPPYSGGVFARGALLPDGKTWRLAFEPKGSPGWQFSDPRRPPIIPGDRFVYVTRRANSGIMVTLCDTVTLAHLTFHAAGALTTAFVNNTGPLLVDHLDIGIPPGSPRLISSDADGAHFQNNRGPVTVQYSSFRGMADDAIAIYSLATTINQVTATGPSGKIVDYSPRPILEGDRLQILDAATGAIRGLGTVTLAKAFKCPPEAVMTGCYDVTLDAVPAGTSAGDIAYNYSAAGNGASIHHNVFGAHRGNGVLLFSPDSSVADNEFAEVPKNAVTIGPYHAGFAMGPVPDHVAVRRNSFNGGEVESVDVLAASAIPKSGARGNEIEAVEGPSDIVIADNRFHNAAYPAIEVAVGERIELVNNALTSDPAVIRKPGPAVRLSAGSALSVNGLAVGPAGGVSAAVEIGCGVRAVDPSRWTIRSGSVPAVVDLRPRCR
jgi:hypothetical protein